MKWLILFAAIIIIAYLIIKTIQEQGLKGQTKKINKEIELLEAQINFLRGLVMQKEAGSIAAEPLEDLRMALQKMEDKYHRLKEIHKNDLKFVLEITKDWLNYVNSLQLLHSAWCQLETDLSVTANENYGAKVVEPKIIKEDTEKKFNDLLEIKEKKKSYDEKELGWIWKSIKRGLKK